MDLSDLVLIGCLVFSIVFCIAFYLIFGDGSKLSDDPVEGNDSLPVLNDVPDKPTPKPAPKPNDDETSDKPPKNYVSNIIKATIDRNLDSIKYILAHQTKEEINITEENGMNALHLAIINNCQEIAELLIKSKKIDVTVQGTNLKVSCFGLSFLTENNDLTKMIIEYNDVDVNENIIGKVAPLIFCATKGNLEMVKYLVKEKNANINVTNADGENCLLLAIENDQLEVSKWLITNGININACTSEDLNVFHYIIKNFPQNGKTENDIINFMKFIIENSNVHTKDLVRQKASSDMVTPMFFAIAGKLMSVIEYLINELGVDPNDEAAKNLTPLVLSIVSDNKDLLVKLLTTYNVKITQKLIDESEGDLKDLLLQLKEKFP